MPKPAKSPRFVVHHPSAFTLYVIDTQHPKGSTLPGPRGPVMMFPTLGGQYATQQLPGEALHLAHKVARLLNA